MVRHRITRWVARACAATLTISKASYYDKTLAGILGQVGGVITGYEYASPNPHPTDECFRPAYGPYSGDAPLSCWTPNNYPGYDRVGAPNFADHEVGSDDDYHIDFFNQLILDEHGPAMTNTVTVWGEGGGGSTSFLSVKDYASGAPELKSGTPALGWPKWHRQSISGVQVTNGTLTVGFYSTGGANQWSSFDAVQLWRQ